VSDSGAEGKAVWDFLKNNPVPAVGTESFGSWRGRCLSLGPTTSSVFIKVLENGDEAQQYGALVGLRLYGYEVWAEGYGLDVTYRVRAPEQLTGT
jgi:hypothetical protein